MNIEIQQGALIVSKHEYKMLLSIKNEAELIMDKEMNSIKNIIEKRLNEKIIEYNNEFNICQQ